MIVYRPADTVSAVATHVVSPDVTEITAETPGVAACRLASADADRVAAAVAVSGSADSVDPDTVAQPVIAATDTAAATNTTSREVKGLYAINLGRWGRIRAGC